MAAEKILKYLNLIVDGRGYAGKMEAYSAPDLSVVTEEFRGGGMDAAIDIDMGMEKLSTSFKLKSYDDDVLALFGVKQGAGVQFTAKGALEDRDGTITPVVHAMRGKLIQLQRGEWISGSGPSLTCNLTLDYYREEVDGRVVHEIDPVNMIRIIDGVDQLSDARAAIGV